MFLFLVPASASANGRKEAEQTIGLTELYKQGNDLYNQKNYVQAAKAFEMALPLAKGQNIPMVMRRIAESYHQAHMDDKAISMYQKILQITPRNAVIYNNLGIAYAGMGQAAEATQAFQKAVEVDPAHAATYLANSQAATKQIESERASKDEAAAGDAAAQTGQMYDALRHYSAALQGLPENPLPDVDQPLREKIIKLVLRMDPRPAIPQDAMRHLAYAETAFQEAKGPLNLDNAIQELNKALRLAPWWGDAYKNLGLLYEKENRYADAARNLGLYLLATPNSPDAQSVQMKIYSLQYKAKQHGASN